MKPRCAYCGEEVNQPTSAINRALREGKLIYCNRTCAGLGRRGSEKTAAQKKEEKRLYDLNYRATNPTLKDRKAAYHKRTYDPVKAAAQRKARAPYHAEYCRQPEYKAWKKQYDQEYRAKKYYGEFWEAFIALMLIEKEVGERITRQEVYATNNTLNKKQRRRRSYERAYSNHA